MATYTFIDSNRLIGRERAPIEIVNRGESSFKADLLELYEGIQADRTAMLAQVRELQLAAQLLLAVEAGRIAAASPGDDRVAALAAGSLTIVDRVAMLDAEVDYAAVRVPMVRKTEALLQGRITDDANRAAGAVTVTLADERGVPIEGVPPAVVDDAGYYAIVVPAEVAAEVGADRKLSLVVSHGTDRVPAGVAPLTLGAGAVKVQDVRLPAASLDTLKFGVPTQLDAGTARIVSPKAAGRRGAATSAPAKRSPRKGKKRPD